MHPQTMDFVHLIHQIPSDSIQFPMIQFPTLLSTGFQTMFLMELVKSSQKNHSCTL